jgi:uncharacterized membrane protein YgcG
MVRRHRHKLALATLLLASSVTSLGGTSCSTEPSCESVCDNYIDLCVSDLDTDPAYNACLETCTGSNNDIPAACGTQRDEVLICLADAESLDCASPQSSAACEEQNGTLYECLVKEAGGSGGSGGSGGGGGSGGAAASTSSAGGTAPEP